MVDKDMLEALSKMMDDKLGNALKPVNERLDGMSDRLDRIEEETRHTRILVESTNKNLKLMCEAQQETAGKFKQLDRVEMTLNDVKSDTEVIKDVVQWHSGDIKTLKKA